MDTRATISDVVKWKDWKLRSNFHLYSRRIIIRISRVSKTFINFLKRLKRLIYEYFVKLTCWSDSSAWVSRITRYQISQRELFAANDENKFICKVIREHFSDLEEKRKIFIKGKVEGTLKLNFGIKVWAIKIKSWK